MIEYGIYNDIKIAYLTEIKINSMSDMLDLMAEIYFADCARIIISKEALPESFFSLKTGFAGDILQKFSNYSIKLAIVGDFSGIKSGALRAFIYECNRGNQVFFKQTYEEAAESLIKA